MNENPMKLLHSTIIRWIVALFILGVAWWSGPNAQGVPVFTSYQVDRQRTLPYTEVGKNRLTAAHPETALFDEDGAREQKTLTVVGSARLEALERKQEGGSVRPVQLELRAFCGNVVSVVDTIGTIPETGSLPITLTIKNDQTCSDYNLRAIGLERHDAVIDSLWVLSSEDGEERVLAVPQVTEGELGSFDKTIARSGGVPLTGRKQSLGAIITWSPKNPAEELRGVEIPVRITGQGGFGFYRLFVQELMGRNSKGEARLGQVVGRHDFYVDSPGAIQELGKQVDYRLLSLPLAAHLEVGKEYLVGIDTQFARRNRFHHLEWVGGPSELAGDAYSSSKISAIKELPIGIRTEIGSATAGQSRSVLTETADAYTLRYQAAGIFSDILDTCASCDITQRAEGRVQYFDTYQRAIISPAGTGTGITYEVTVPYAATHIEITGKTLPAPHIPVLFRVSTDGGRNWTEQSDQTVLRESGEPKEHVEFDLPLSVPAGGTIQIQVIAADSRKVTGRQLEPLFGVGEFAYQVTMKK